ncbi:MAG: YnbE family lipoprotein [Bdellovibrionales bacterium]|nr:YnbE family lipoprotein [Bdellovibrionales bacterium]
MKTLILALVTGFVLINCAPTVTLQAPEKPLEINLNVKIDHQIKVQVDKELDDVMTGNDDIF